MGAVCQVRCRAPAPFRFCLGPPAWRTCPPRGARSCAPSPGTQTDLGDVEWIEVGKLTTTYGVRGEIRVSPSTDFPKQRLGTPGVRWGPGGASFGAGTATDSTGESAALHARHAPRAGGWRPPLPACPPRRSRRWRFDCWPAGRCSTRCDLRGAPSCWHACLATERAAVALHDRSTDRERGKKVGGGGC